MNEIDFPKGFEALTGNLPFPWQEAMYERLAKGDIPESCNLPTGLGKTSIIPIWLIALANGSRGVPRRLVYVVNRRTVVDQATDEAFNHRKRLLEPKGEDTTPEVATLRRRIADGLRRLTAFPDKPEHQPLAISTLRGQFADNREWSADPARPAVIVGTVDMIGSRLLFSGYGIGFRLKPLHAGFIGQDALLVHDEAHLEPAFQKLLIAIKREQGHCKEFRSFHVMEMSATSRGVDAFGLEDEDRSHPEVSRRIHASKTIRLHENIDEKKLPDRIAELALSHRGTRCNVLVFARTVEAVEKIAEKLAKAEQRVERLTGTLRGKERDELVGKELFRRFLSKAEPGGDTAYLVCTSAGEVGVNISADHMVCDLSTFESMAQRFGRVNRFGDRDDTRIDVVYPKVFDEEHDIESRRRKTLDLLRELNGDGSPDALGKLDADARFAAFSPSPVTLPTSDILFDAWALTSIRGKLPGRPAVEPYLHGLTDWEPPVTQVAWREEVGVVIGDLRDQHKPEVLLADYPLKPQELLRDRSDRVLKHLAALAVKHPVEPAWLLDEDGTVTIFPLKDLADKDKKERIHRRTVLLPPRVGGLQGGLLNSSSGEANDVADEWYEDPKQEVARRIRVRDDDLDRESKIEKIEGMRLVREIAINPINVGDEDESTGQRWRWYVRPRSADDDLSKTSPSPVTWDEHTDQVTDHASGIATALALPEGLQQAIELAAKFHDLGKKREVWQRSIGNPKPTDWHAKSGRGWKPREITDYRHEFGSLLDAIESEGMVGPFKDLVLHLIAAHHGRGRPHFEPDEAFDPEHAQGKADATASDVPRRFARLQRAYGRWGLAYLESLLRAADYAASAEPNRP